MMKKVNANKVYFIWSVTFILVSFGRVHLETDVATKNSIVDALTDTFKTYFDEIQDDHPLSQWTEQQKTQIARHKARWAMEDTDGYDFSAKELLWFNTAGLVRHVDRNVMRENNNKGRRLKRDIHVSPTNDTQVQLPKKLVRKEIRQLTEHEWDAYIHAVTAMKNNYPDENSNSSEYDLFTYAHRRKMAPGGHDGAAFLPWHREHLWRFERSVQKYSPGLGVPYWDTTLDFPLPQPEDAVIWTDWIFGPPTGNITSGPFANWPAVPQCEFIGKNLTREYINGSPAKDFLISNDDVLYINNLGQYAKLVVGEDPLVESKHNSVHEVVGGHLAWISCSVTDPVFWLHHSFIDKLWEDFRRDHQNTDPTKDYPSGLEEDIGGIDHEAYNYMYPFEPVLNIHGLSNHYTDYYYEYAHVPNNCSTNGECGSDLLWCLEARCVSKIRIGGSCEGLSNDSCDLDAECINDVCAITDDKNNVSREASGLSTQGNGTGTEKPAGVGGNTESRKRFGIGKSPIGKKAFEILKPVLNNGKEIVKANQSSGIKTPSNGHVQLITGKETDDGGSDAASSGEKTRN